MTTSVSVHRCIASRDCRRAETIDGKRRGALTEDQHTLCPVCRTHIETCIRQLPRDWAELRAALGERATTNSQKIRSTPTPAIPISTRKEALMAAIVDMADRAAAVVSDKLHTGQPVTYHGRGIPTHAERTVRASVAIVEPNVDLLAAAPPEPAIVWTKPSRCDTHQHLIDSAETWLESEPRPREKQVARDAVRRAYAAAGACDDCNGWGSWGQERELTELSGMQIALQLAELHNQARAELGLTRLRHRYPMPCPRCGGRVGRDDGQTIVTCDDRDTCRSSWTEREYQFLAGLITRERLDMEILKYLLAEAYARLDALAQAADIVRNNEFLDTDPSGGRTVLEIIDAALKGHQKPADRVISTERKATEDRQATEDSWAWKNETPYRPPKRKHRKAARTAGQPIHPGSLSTLVDIDESVASIRGMVCPECNVVHVGECT